MCYDDLSAIHDEVAPKQKRQLVQRSKTWEVEETHGDITPLCFVFGLGCFGRGWRRGHVILRELYCIVNAAQAIIQVVGALNTSRYGPTTMGWVESCISLGDTLADVD